MKFLQSSAHRLNYDVIDLVAPWHDRRPAILFHHGVGSSMEIWTDWIFALADRYRIIRFDMLGFGRSEVPASDFTWTIKGLGADILAVADAAEAPTFHFVGESMGGTIGLNTALDHQGRFASLTVSNGSHMGGSIEKVEAWRRQIDDGGVQGWSDQFMEDRFYPDSLPSERREWFSHQQAAGNRHSILNALAVLVGTDLRPRLASLRKPALLLHADASPFVPAAVMADLHAHLADSELQIFSHAKHGLPFSHGRACAGVLRAFLERKSK